ncbi:translation initiation factor IF-2 subunit gamma [Candidatus Bathyarchaeota archaeon]|nr:translation initiation factor IF-2 subunit gamma [Candidatus Bathyarchaeota archaeon]MBS7613810.1 translation initiation factor IF-2 subunit gamma [Candidatus Bathyarchaeota archaeon]MBS7617183.1 translation initiation factor IF-2 subunit gamma [Candidatus Bathyarchaeota archaeon]
MSKVYEKAPECNIGTAGHVDHGKTTLVEALTGIWTSRHSEEIKRGITIKLGYADAGFYKCPVCPPPKCYSTQPVCANCGSKTELLRVVSFVDAPGHEVLMATMLSGAAVMDGAMLVIAANETCPQPQTKEHLAALEVAGVKNIVIVQNKIELVTSQEALKNYQQIKEFVKGTIAENAPIIPVSAQNKVNIDYLIEAIEKHIPTPKRDLAKPPIMYIVRSFDVNKPGTRAIELSGGVVGGTIVQGVLRVGDEVEIRPGIISTDDSGRSIAQPLITRIVSLKHGGLNVDEARCGGLVGVGTSLDPSLTKADNLAGNLIGKPSMLPDIVNEITLDTSLFETVVGAVKQLKVEKIKPKEPLLLNILTAITLGVVKDVRENRVMVNLKKPVCTSKGQRVAVSRRINDRWRLIGYGVII